MSVLKKEKDCLSAILEGHKDNRKKMEEASARPLLLTPSKPCRPRACVPDSTFPCARIRSHSCTCSNTSLLIRERLNILGKNERRLKISEQQAQEDLLPGRCDHSTFIPSTDYREELTLVPVFVDITVVVFLAVLYLRRCFVFLLVKI